MGFEQRDPYLREDIRAELKELGVKKSNTKPLMTEEEFNTFLIQRKNGRTQHKLQTSHN